MTLFRTIARRAWVNIIRYPLETPLGLVIYYIFFLVLFFGAKTFGGPGVNSSDTLSSIAVGYVVFLLTQQSYQDFAGQAQQESMTGTLEQLALSRYGLLGIFTVDFLIKSVFAVFQFGIVLIPIMATTGRWLHFDAASVFVLLALTMAGVMGLGLIAGGVALVFKRIGGFAGLLGIAFIALVAAPVDRYPLLKLLPVGHGNFLLRQVLVKQQGAFLNGQEILILLAVSAGYLVLGAIVFRLMERAARNRALLGQY